MSDGASAYESDALSKQPIDEQVQNLFAFVQQHESLLEKINETNYESVMCTSHEQFFRTIQFASEPPERVFPQDLLPSSLRDNVRKVLIVFIYLCEEISQLKTIAENRFYRPLTMFGQLPLDSPSVSESKGKGGQSSDSSDSPKVDLQSFGKKEALIGQYLPLFQELMQFISRGYSILINFIQQLSQLYSESYPLYRILFQNTHVLTWYNSLNELLTIFITLDAIMSHNTTLIQSWYSYKAMISSIRHDPDNYSTNINEINELEKQLTQLDMALFTNHIFLNAIELNFEDGSHNVTHSHTTGSTVPTAYIKVRTNQTFLENTFLVSIKLYLENAINKMNGQVYEEEEYHKMVGCLGMYALYRHLLPRNIPPDHKLYRMIWQIQKYIPMIVMADSVIWKIDVFFKVHNIHLEIKKLDPINPTAYIPSYLEKYDLYVHQMTTILAQQIPLWMIAMETRCPDGIHTTSTSTTTSTASTITYTSDSMDNMYHLLSKGLVYSKKIHYFIKSLLIMHTELSIPFTKTLIHDIYKLLELLKGIEGMIIRKEITHLLSYRIAMIQQCEEYIYTHLITPCKQRYLSLNKSDTRIQMLFSLLYSLEMLLKSLYPTITNTMTTTRILMIQMIMEIILSHASSSSSSSNILKLSEKEKGKLISMMNTWIMMITYNNEINKATNTAFMYFHNELFHNILHYLYENSTISGISGSGNGANRLLYYIRVFEDGIIYCQQYPTWSPLPTSTSTTASTSTAATTSLIPEINNAFYCQSYRNYLLSSLHSIIIQPLSNAIENDLRYHIHTKHLSHMIALNPKTENLKPLNPFLALPTLRILGVLFNIHSEITHYLNYTFYALTSIALHDWRTYSAMRNLAYEKYNLQLMDNYLPMGSLEQGEQQLDILQIMRNIHIFVSRFSYNSHCQEFVEYRTIEKAGTGAANGATVSKHLNTIKIQSIAASIRQHGLGILNTTVNFTYQFISKKIAIFVQFLADAYISAFLSKEHRYFKKNKIALLSQNPANTSNQSYPYDRASNFVKDIKKLGLNDVGKSYLDQFRILVTEIGNALGYVRMVRSASMYYCSEAVKYLPEISDAFVPNFMELIKQSCGYDSTLGEENAGEAFTARNTGNGSTTEYNYHAKESMEAAKNIDTVISTLLKNFGEGNSDYFQILVKVFQDVLDVKEHEHLKHFYMMVPPMCISWMEASLTAKENMHKSGRGGSIREVYFTDDGFAMGVAYCLAILKQTKKYNALHWKDSVEHKLRIDEQELNAKQQVRAAKEAKKKAIQDEKVAKKRSSFLGISFGLGGGGSKQSDNNHADEEEDTSYEEQDEIHTLQLTSKRLEGYRNEYEQLFYSMTGAEIFFKRTDNVT